MEPGESIFIDTGGNIHKSLYSKDLELNPCIFEYVYFSRPDSIIDGVNVQEARMRMGKQLANKILREWADNDIDVIIPIPDTSRTAALEMAIRLNKNYRENNTEKIKATKKKWYEDNKEQINQYQSQPIICECGATITKSCIARHRRSNFHQEYENLWN